MTDFAFFEFRSSSAHSEQLKVRCRYGGGTIETKGGTGVYKVVARPYLPALTVWEGPKEPLTHTIPFVLDGYEHDVDQHPAVQQIMKMGGWVNGAQTEEPPQLILDGYGTILADFTQEPSNTWVLSAPPMWGARIVNEEGTLVRQEGKLTFLLFNTDATILRVAPPAAHKIVHIAKSGETFETVAYHLLGDAGLGTKLAQFNDRYHTHEKLEPGQSVEVPDKTEQQYWKSHPHFRP